MKKIIFFIVIFLLSISIVVSIPPFPQPPLIFQGDVKIDGRGDLAESVSFSINGEEVANSDVVDRRYSVMIQYYPEHHGKPIDITITPIVDEYEEDFYEAEQEIYYIPLQDIFLDLTALTEKALEIIIYNPEEDKIVVTETGNVEFDLTADTGYDETIEENKIKYKWYLDGDLDLEGVLVSGDTTFYTYTVYDNDIGIHNIAAKVSDSFLTRTKEWTLIIGKPIVDEFDGDTTDFSDIYLNELDDVPNVIFEKSENGKIEFLENLNLVGVYDIKNTVKIENGIVAVDTSTYGQFKNEPARITLRNLRYNSIPIIYYNEGFTTNGNEINKECDFCEIISYTDFPTTNGEVIFEVEHFSSFKVGGSGQKYDLDKFYDLDKCSLGKQGNLKVKIKEPDNNDDFKFGEKIEIEVEVENNNEEDLDIIVEAILYDIDEDDEIEKIESKDIEINDNDEETFELSLEVPKFDEDNNFILFVKAYEDDNENEQCNYDLIDLNLEKEKHDVIINEVKIMPDNIPNGGSFKALVEVENIGRKDIEDVYVVLKNRELNINLETDRFELKDNEIKIASFSVIIPEDIDEKNYELEAFVYFDNRENSKEGNLNVEKEEIIKRKYVYEDIGPINIKIVEKDVLKEFIENIEIPEIPSYLHIILFGIVVLLTLGFLYREI